MKVFNYSLDTLKKERKKEIALLITYIVVTVILITVFAIVQTRANSLWFMIAMILVGLIGTFFVIKTLTLDLPTIKQLMYYAQRNEVSAKSEVGIFKNFGNKKLIRNLEFVEAFFDINEATICFYIEASNVPQIINGKTYKLNHANLVILSLDEVTK